MYAWPKLARPICGRAAAETKLPRRRKQGDFSVLRNQSTPH